MGLFDANMQTTSGSTTQSYPDWYMNAQKGVTQGALSVANRGYTPYSGPRIAATSPDTLASYDAIRGAQGNWAPLLGQSGQAVDQALGKSAYGAATPYLDKASQTLPGVIGSYMSPYTANVVDRIGALGARNLTENILPGINQTFVGGGSFGGKRNSEFVSRAIRDTQEATAAEQAKALESGYTQAGQMAQQDLSRLGQLGQVAGNLTSADATALLQGAQQRAANASQMQGQSLKDAAALQSIGQAQQDQSQKSLDLAYQDFLNQRDWDKGQVEWMSGVLSGNRLPTSSTTTSTTPAASDGQQVVGALTALAGLPWDDIGGWLGFRKGGHVKKYARGGMVNSYPEDDTLDAFPLGDGTYSTEKPMQGDFGPLDDETLKKMLASPDPYLRNLAQQELLSRSTMTGGVGVPQLGGDPGEDYVTDEVEEHIPTDDGEEEVTGALTMSAPQSVPAASTQGALSAYAAPSQGQSKAREAVRAALAKPSGSWADNPLLQAGLSIMSNRRPDFLGALGEGIGAAAQSAKSRQGDERERLLKLAQAELGFANNDAELAVKGAKSRMPINVGGRIWDPVSRTFLTDEKVTLPAGMMMGKDGKPAWIPGYKEGRAEIAAAGRSSSADKAPSGYRFGSSGDLEFIPGGPADPSTKPKGKQVPPNIAKGMLDNLRAVKKVDAAMSALDANPESVGFWKGVGNKVLPMDTLNTMDPKGAKARALIADIGSLVIHDRSGAAVTAAEFPRLKPFIPSPGDDPETVRTKLRNFRNEYMNVLRDTSEAYSSDTGYTDFKPVSDFLSKEAPAEDVEEVFTEAPQTPANRKPNTVYRTPKGNLKWTGTGWVKP